VFIQADGSPKVTGFGGWIDGGTEGDEALTRTEQFLPYFQSEITDETRRRDLRSVASLLCTMIQARPHAVSVPTDPGAGAAQAGLVRVNSSATFSQLLSDTLDPKSPHAPTSAGGLRDALVAFVLAERSNRRATAALGVSLSASMSGPAGSDSTATAAPGAARVDRPDLVALALERLGESLQSARMQLARLRPWARQNRLVLSLAGGLVVAGLVLGNLLGQLRLAPAAEPAAGSARASTSTGVGTALSTAGAASGTVIFRIQPWGEILIDNKPIGVSPPLDQLALAPGPHQVEVRHGNDPVWIARIDVEAAAPVTVTHRFE
jgi:hypothetical protein